MTSRPPAAVAAVARLIPVLRLRFEFLGPMVPYVRMTQRSKFADPRAGEYLASKDNIGLAMRNQMSWNDMQPIPDKHPFALKIKFRRSALFTADLDNLVKAALDAMQGIVFRDDRYCVRIEARKERGPDGFVATLLSEEVDNGNHG